MDNIKLNVLFMKYNSQNSKIMCTYITRKYNNYIYIFMKFSIEFSNYKNNSFNKFTSQHF